MLISQGTTASFALGDPYVVDLRGDAETFEISTDSPSTLAENSPSGLTLEASTLGGYSIQQLMEVANRLISDPSMSLPVVSFGNPSTGFYGRRNLYVSSGSLSSSSGPIQGQFVTNANYFVDGTPPSTNPNSTAGLFPINGQYFLNSQYRTLAPTTQTGGLPTQQYAINASDPITQTAQYNAVLVIQGNVGSSNPAFVTGYQFRNGQYIADLYYRQNAIATLQPTGSQAFSPSSNVSGQILVNGQNLFRGNFNAVIGNQEFPTPANGSVLLQGSYNSQGYYAVGSQVLTDGQNYVPGFLASQGVLTPVQINLDGAYNSGGQFIVYNTAPFSSNQSTQATTSPPPYNQGQSVASAETSADNEAGDSYDPIAAYLQSIASIIRNTIGGSYNSANAEQVLAGSYLSIEA